MLAWAKLSGSRTLVLICPHLYGRLADCHRSEAVRHSGWQLRFFSTAAVVDIRMIDLTVVKHPHTGGGESCSGAREESTLGHYVLSVGANSRRGLPLGRLRRTLCCWRLCSSAAGISSHLQATRGRDQKTHAQATVWSGDFAREPCTPWHRELSGQRRRGVG